LYFLQHAEELDTEHLPEQLQVTEIRQALEELQMLSKDQLEREEYEARLRVQRDESILARAAEISHETGFKKGLQEGLVEGRNEGLVEGRKEVWVEMIQRFQRGLKRAVSAREELLTLSLAQLQALAEHLEREIFGPAAT
jgi:flagellar biosynthesis/type III secretory pathway protein FliH